MLRDNNFSTTPGSFYSSAMLSSERIILKYGNYGMELIENGPTFRISNLFSTDNVRTTRILALVHYPEKIHPDFREEHMNIISGHSIGTTFQQNGWKIEKNHICCKELSPSKVYTWIYDLMGILPIQPLPVCIYDFKIHKKGQTHKYATIVELYHPDFLSVSDLQLIYKKDLMHEEELTPDVRDMYQAMEEKLIKSNQK